MKAYQYGIVTTVAVATVLTAGICFKERDNIYKAYVYSVISRKFDVKVTDKTIIGFVGDTQGSNTDGLTVIMINPTNDLEEAALQIYRQWEITNGTFGRLFNNWYPLYANGYVGNAVSALGAVGSNKNKIFYYKSNDRTSLISGDIKISPTEKRFPFNDEEIKFLGVQCLLDKSGKGFSLMRENTKISDLNLLEMYANIERKEDVEMAFYEHDNPQMPD